MLPCQPNTRVRDFQSPADKGRLNTPGQVAIAIAIGIAVGAARYFRLLERPGAVAVDFTWPWRAARILIDGHNPYQVITATGPFPFDGPFYYPLTAAVAALPFAPLRPAAAGGIFIGVSTALLVFGMLRTARAHLLRSVGSCSFEDAVTDLRRLGWIAADVGEPTRLPR